MPGLNVERGPDVDNEPLGRGHLDPGDLVVDVASYGRVVDRDRQRGADLPVVQVDEVRRRGGRVLRVAHVEVPGGLRRDRTRGREYRQGQDCHEQDGSSDRPYPR